MKVNAIVSQANGVISVILQATFVGDQTDMSDKQRIAAFGDPVVNIAGSFTDPSNPSFVFQFPTTEMWVGVTTQLSSQVVRFMEALPQAQNPNQPAPIQGPLDCVTLNPSEAATSWASILMASGTGRIAQAMQQLRSQTPVPVINPVTV
jgi:hypothetical protein